MRIEADKKGALFEIKYAFNKRETDNPEEAYDLMLAVTHEFARIMVAGARNSGAEDVTMNSFLDKLTNDLRRISGVKENIVIVNK